MILRGNVRSFPVVRVKICGVTNAADARLAADCGADAVGVLVGQRHPSTDFVSPQDGREILGALLPFIAATLVTHEDDPGSAGAIEE